MPFQFFLRTVKIEQNFKWKDKRKHLDTLNHIVTKHEI